MIVDRLTYAEEHVKGNLVFSDIIIAMEDYGVELYKKMGFSNVLYVPGAGSVGYDPYQYPKLNTEKIYDVVFIGNYSSPFVYRKRNKILSKLASLTDKYKILITHTLDYQEYLLLMNQAKIVLDTTIDSKALNYRMFQAMGLEALCFAEDDNPMVTELYEDKKEIVLYNLDNLDELLGYYLKNSEERNRIAHNGYLKTINHYTHYHFSKMVLDKLLSTNFTKSQKTQLEKKTVDNYKGIVMHYKKKPFNAIAFFEAAKTGNEPALINNIMVQKIMLYTSEASGEQDIRKIYNANRTSVMISFNYLMVVFYLKKDYDVATDLVSSVLTRLASGHYEITGLYYIPETEKYLHEYFKFRTGQLIFSHGPETQEYHKGILKLLEEHCYRLKAVLKPDEAVQSLGKALELGSTYLWDYYDLAWFYKESGNEKLSRQYMEKCREILPFEEKFSTGN